MIMFILTIYLDHTAAILVIFPVYPIDMIIHNSHHIKKGPDYFALQPRFRCTGLNGRSRMAAS